MKSVRIKKIITIFLVVILLNIYMFSGNTVFASQNLAFSVATKFDDLDTIDVVADAAQKYLDVGYHSYAIGNPEPEIFGEYLYADVQLFATHGSPDHISYSKTGICVGDSITYPVDQKLRRFFGTNDIPWRESGTILVTYLCCNTAGVDNVPDRTSISYKTAESGAQVTLGFREEIHLPSVTSWSSRYNEKLSQGYGVDDAVKYANSFMYLYPNIKTGHIWHHGDPNIKIGKYRTNSMASTMSEDKRLINVTDKYNEKENLNNAIQTIKKNNTEFNIDNYDISYSNLTSEEIGTNETVVEAEYIDLQFKIGEFKTEAGYTIELKNGNVVNIYDNNIDLAKQNLLLKSNSKLSTTLTDNKIKALESEAIKDVSENIMKDEKIIVNNQDVEYIYFYDIKTDKKYIVFSVPNTLEGDEDATAVMEVRYEI